MKFGLRLTSLAAIVAFGMAWATLSAWPLSPGVQPANQATIKLEMRLAEKQAAVGLAEAAVSGSAEKIYSPRRRSLVETSPTARHKRSHPASIRDEGVGEICALRIDTSR